VPPSIVRREILPALARQPSYFERHDMEIVAGPGDRARAVPANAENLELLRAGSYRLRQRPGPQNALWLLKFMVPNEHDVYLHGTPAPELFRRARRDLSHGCVRVEDPVGLAEWALESEPDWTRGRIEAAMYGRQTVSVALSRPIQVVLFYVTVTVMPEDGLLHFAEDIYGHDARLDRALAAKTGRLPEVTNIVPIDGR
jgi:murein L,D-transpeptidase YcbB/YkuD